MRQSSSAKRTTGSSLVEVSSFQHAAVSQRVVSTPQSLQAGAGREIGKLSVFAILKQREVASELGAERNAVSWTMVAKQMYICSMNCVPVSLSLTYERAEDHALGP